MSLHAVAAVSCVIVCLNIGAASLAAAEDAAAGRAVFDEHCARCHNPDAAGKTYGPSLVGIIGRKAASVEGFEYSDALKKSGLVWTVDALRAWMADNTGLLPGTRMRHVGVNDPLEQDMLLAYLNTLK